MWEGQKTGAENRGRRSTREELLDLSLTRIAIKIQRDFIEWQSPLRIAGEHGIVSPPAIYRHAHAFGLFAKRDRNIRAALARFIEKAGEVEPTAPAIVAAIQAYAKINAQGQWVERSEHLNLNGTL